MLTIDNVIVRYGKTQALSDVSLKLGGGEILLVVGRNGAGKTSLLRAVVGLSRVSSGTVLLADRDITNQSPAAIYRRGIVLVPQGRGIFADQSVRNNLRLGAFGRIVSRSHLSRRSLADEISIVLDRIPVLRDKLDQHAGSLSGGQQQLLALGRALLSDPKILLIDEPSMGLDPINRALIIELVASLNRDGVSVLMVEQRIPRFPESVAVRAALLTNGRVSRLGSVSDIVV